jgi:hypothetical protein
LGAQWEEDHCGRRKGDDGEEKGGGDGGSEGGQDTGTGEH